MLLCTSTYYKEYNVLQSTILYYKGLQSTGAFCSAQLCKCNETVRHSRLIVLTHDTSSTLRGASYGMQNTLAVARRSLGVFCIRGFHCALEVSRVLLLWVLLSSQRICHFTTSHNCIASHHMASQLTTSHKHIASQPHNIPCHPMVSHHITSHQVTSHDSAPQHVASHTAHHMA